MSDNELVRQWKNPQARTADVAHPAGDIALDELAGGKEPRTEYIFSLGCCYTGVFC